MVKFLLETNANIDQCGDKPAERNGPKMSGSGDPDYTREYGFRAPWDNSLSVAVRCCNLEIVQLLVEKGANPLAPTRNRQWDSMKGYRSKRKNKLEVVIATVKRRR
jgi:hypothetical protein